MSWSHSACRPHWSSPQERMRDCNSWSEQPDFGSQESVGPEWAWKMVGHNPWKRATIFSSETDNRPRQSQVSLFPIYKTTFTSEGGEGALGGSPTDFSCTTIGMDVQPSWHTGGSSVPTVLEAMCALLCCSHERQFNFRKGSWIMLTLKQEHQSMKTPKSHPRFSISWWSVVPLRPLFYWVETYLIIKKWRF